MGLYELNPSRLAGVYNRHILLVFVPVPLAMMGLITPWMAGLGTKGSALLVVLSALRLQRQSKKDA
jgi:cation transport ATPase